ncbi:hypothetical protein BZG36_02650 [Bifiguratus adelaidae]|uniref:Uncharacterized protein n=1 Tax=Bifiguratus adelaidae TaxID=1938954 RepID=A0A261Y2U1_9FUNG|nr:hypothetical protein BZG36_02650 [Bifiguratus adelaidae]
MFRSNQSERSGYEYDNQWGGVSDFNNSILQNEAEQGSGGSQPIDSPVKFSNSNSSAETGSFGFFSSLGRRLSQGASLAEKRDELAVHSVEAEGFETFAAKTSDDLGTYALTEHFEEDPTVGVSSYTRTETVPSTDRRSSLNTEPEEQAIYLS